MPKLTLPEVQQRAALRGQELVSRWRGMNHPAQWRCLACKTKRIQRPRVILIQARGANTGCPECRRLANKKREEVKREERVRLLLAERGGGRCLEGMPKLSRVLVRWECAVLGHPPFQASLDAIKHTGRWCPLCTARRAESYGETLCRVAFTDLLGEEFLNIHLPGVGELDGYCAALNIAWEHQGEQYYGFVARFHRSPADFVAQQVSDRQKLAACVARNLFLVIIPAIPGRLRLKHLRAHIISELRRLGCPNLPADLNDRAVDYSRVHRPDPHGSFARLKGVAKSAGLTIAEEGWMGSNHLYHLGCLRCGKLLTRTATEFFHRRRKGERVGCRACSLAEANRPQRKDPSELLAEVAHRGLVLLTPVEELYASAKARGILTCKRCTAEKRPTPPWSIGRRALLGGRYGCRSCQGCAKLTAEEVHKRAEKRGWKLDQPLPDVFNVKTPITLFDPACGERFKARIASLTSLKSCPVCQRKKRGGNPTKRLNQFDAEKAAREKGWELLDAYKNSKFPARYRCSTCQTVSVRSHNSLSGSMCQHCPR